MSELNFYWGYEFKVIIDACTLIYFIQTEALNILGKTFPRKVIIPGGVFQEVNHSDQRRELTDAIRRRHIRKINIFDRGLIKRKSEIIREHSLGKGEAECLTLAEKHGYFLISDETSTYYKCDLILGYNRGYQHTEVLVRSVIKGVLNIEEAKILNNDIYNKMPRTPQKDFDELYNRALKLKD